MIRIAAVADVHFGRDSKGALRPHLERLPDRADVLLIAGDLTWSGKLDEARVLAAELAHCPVPTVAVLGNHDYHCDEDSAIAAVLDSAGVQVLEGNATVVEANGRTLGVAGTKGFGGGFPGGAGSEFGEPEMKAFIRHTRLIAERLEKALAGIDAERRVALMHYAPVKETLVGESPELYPFLGSYLLAEAVERAGADLVLHGHAHGGQFEASLEGVPVYNVSLPVMRQDFWIFELSAAAERASSALH